MQEVFINLMPINKFRGFICKSFWKDDSVINNKKGSTISAESKNVSQSLLDILLPAA